MMRDLPPVSTPGHRRHKALVIEAAAYPDKPSLRARMRQVRAACASADSAAAERAADALPLEAVPPFGVVAGYWPAGAEMSPLPLMRRLASAGADLALPVAEDRHAPLRFRRWCEGDDLAPDAFGICAPVASADDVRPDLVIAPLLAFDAAGSRLGQGAGHYDRTLQRLRAQGPLFVLGLGYAGQEADHLPSEPHDERLDGILTETGFRRVPAEVLS